MSHSVKMSVENGRMTLRHHDALAILKEIESAPEIALREEMFDLPYYVAAGMQDPGFFDHPFADLRAYDSSAAQEIARALNRDFWRKARCFVRAQGYLISHAGVAGAFRPAADATDTACSMRRAWPWARCSWAFLGPFAAKQTVNPGLLFSVVSG